MKTFRVLLSAFAILLAGGLTFASQYTAPGMVNAFEYIPQTPFTPERCKSITIDCGVGLPAPCESPSLNPVGQASNASTQCGPQLSRIP